MKRGQRLNWLMLAICPLIAGAPSSMSKKHQLCPKENLNIAGGTFVLSNGYEHLSFLRYICPNGYYPLVQSRLCQYGLWSPKASTSESPECKKVTCSNPRVLENGKVTPYKNRYYINDTTTYSCLSDYKFRGSAVRVCQPNGKWSGSTPICGHDSDYCPDPGVPPGSSRTGHTFNMNDKVKYRCESSLTLIGSEERVCQEGGQWSGTEPQCYASFTYDTPEEASEAFSSALKSNLEVSQQYEERDQDGKKIILDRDGKLDIYIALDASGSISEEHFEQAKRVIKKLIEKISYYEVSPNYEILIFAAEVTKIISMRNFKITRNLTYLYEQLNNCNYDVVPDDQRGTNIAKSYLNILESMTIEEAYNKEAFLETQHIIMVFTDGQANMGGNPKPKVEQIKQFVTKNDPRREKNLDLYVFGIGDDVKKEGMNGLVSQRDHETHFFVLPNLDETEKMLDIMMDEGTSVRLCGIHQNYYTDNKRRVYPWLAQIHVARFPHGSNCMGSLVTSSYILTAAHCFRNGDTADQITVTLDKNLVVKVKNYILHPDYDITAKQHMGIQEYYEFDVALIQLKQAVDMNVNLRPICLPCTKETNGALKLSDREGTCRKHEELLISNELVEASFTSKMENKYNGPRQIRNIKIKRGKLRDIGVENAKRAKGLENVKNIKDVVTDNFLCSGGTEPTVDDVACKGDLGGATYVNKKDRLIQVGIVSWGVEDICSDNNQDPLSKEHTRDFHTNLFSQNVLHFLKEHLGNDEIGYPLTFL